MQWREAVTDLSANIFTDLFTVNTIDEIDAYDATPNMALQMALYFNVYLFPFWLISSSIFLYLKFYSIGSLIRFLTLAVMIIVTVIECVRLYLGYLGNLSEKIPELAGFWMLSILLQFPLQTFLFTNPYLNPRPAELTINGVMWFLLLAELITGFQALRAAATRAKEYYALKTHFKKLSLNEKKHQDNHPKSD